ncbi:hypothetical protein [Methylocapsa acidiphila]|uniref:hypothetical protein n=1 Tax=Methylocapsa acidiphila TaxID=133552 RepID=UPI0012EC775F|nr:hypothetical protein [Methylocapsa acidiphila]
MLKLAGSLAPFLLVPTVFMPRDAAAQCAPLTGTVNCAGNLTGVNTTFTNPPVTEVDLSGLTSNIVGQTGAQLTSSFGTAGSGHIGVGFIDGGTGDGGTNAGDVTINVTAPPPGAGFQLNAGNAIGLDAESHGGTGGAGGTNFATSLLLPPFFAFGTGGTGGAGGSGGAVNITTSGSGLITTTGDNHHGILALSIGGAGGTGGDADALLGFVGNGGNGGNGGASNSVTVKNTLDVTTSGGAAAGIWAQSVGGAGGNGGTAAGSAVNNGGSGAAAASGSPVQVTNSGTILTQNTNAVGIFAQSVGGFAGSGGGAYGAFSFGGNPSSAGNGGPVTVTATGGAITTTGVGSTAIFAQSIGGGGGAGGGGGGIVGFGGSGSSGGTGGEVIVSNAAILTLEKDLSSGIFAQSVGGGGGTGGIGVGVGVAGVGGAGGAGGDGGVVQVFNTGRINLSGSGSLNPSSGQSIDAAGIYAQSVGGGGGNGGFGLGIAPVGVGGTGGEAGNGQSVLVQNSGDIIHSPCGDCTEAPTIFAQSIGGGGGDGGKSFAGLVAVGGNGGGGGFGNLVTVNNNGNLTASGGMSAGIFAQSVGGGGGNGGYAIAAGAFLAAAVGGNGAKGGSGGAVCVNANGACNGVIAGLAPVTIQTNGFRSAGIFAQSVGGGGGAGGSASAFSVGIYGSASLAIGGTGGSGGTGGNVFVGSAGKITTVGDYSAGIDASSVGGGGGNGGFAISATGGATYASLALAFGGSGGAGNIGGAVTIASTTNISTNGAYASAIEAHSIGGGGGNGGFTVGVAGSAGAGLALTFGGAGGAGADGGVVNVSSVGNLTTGVPGSGVASANSDGIFAESVGGSGGSGGFAISASFGVYGNLSLGLGGNGGKGGDGKAVTVNNNNPATLGNQITTYGSLSDGIFAQSIGGAGGAGGFAVAAGASSYVSVNLGFGGGGGSGGNSDVVKVVSFGGISTFGSRSDGIFAQSLGGGGGNGGFSVAAGGAQYGALSLSMGGSGANGGQGRDVSVDSQGVIATRGDQSTGIFAQSLGGGGGDGGFAVSGTLTTSDTSLNASLAIGGDGGTGATSGSVHVGSVGDISTAGLSSAGIIAQSIGGSGGNGGFSGALQLQNGGAAVARSIGGNGGSGNKGGAVDVESTGNITTQLANSTGIFAQSVGGGGGNGAFSLLLQATYNSTTNLITPKSVGGNGGSSSPGGDVAVTSIGTVATHGVLSDGILAQSVGGGGGNGGFSVGASLSYNGSADVNSVGGNGGTGNDGGKVTVNASASAASSVPGYSIVTTADSSIGILAQSIGGGGGNGGFSVGGSLSINDSASVSTVGGTGSAGGKGGIVNVTNSGGISTGGNNSDAILAQSIGGGGGNGGFSVAGSVSISGGSAKAQTVGGDGGAGNTAGDVKVVSNYVDNSTSAITTTGDMSVGIFAQSVGGGGGNGAFAISGALSIDKDVKANATGGGAGGGNLAGNVTVNSGGLIMTGTANFVGGVFVNALSGAGSVGILAQSIGGGGGSGGVSGAISLSTGGDAATNTIGGKGGAGSDGQKVTVDTLIGSQIVTFGDNASGILAQSVGGGGGNGGFTIGASFTNGSDAKGSTDSVGGTGAGGGAGGEVQVTNRGTIATFGLLSDGIIAQSIGGGGGNGGFAIGGTLNLNGDATTNTTGGQGGAGSNGGKVTVDNSGAIFVNAAGTIGILAQSIGGGGGNGGFAGGLSISTGGKAVTNSVGGSGAGGGDADQVQVTNSAAITANGDQGVGILAQSVGGGGGNGAFALTGSLSTQASTEVLGTGGNGGAAGKGGVVIVANNLGGAITTNGAMAHGIIAQSIGGGGGNGGFSAAANVSLGGDAKSTVGGGAGGAGGAASAVTVDNFDQIVTKGASSVGILAQSVAGGGGAGGFAGGLSFSSGGEVNNSVGGDSGGVGAASSTVTVTNHLGAVIHTFEANSTGILAQSIGGGGGDGAFSISGGVAGSGNGMAQSVGGNGGAGGAGGLVIVNNDGSIQTDKALSYGIYAQSIGGGGGSGGISVAGAYSSSGGATSTVGGTGSAGGDGGEVRVTNTGSILVKGAGSVGIYAQSVGGGGGAGGFSGALNFTSGGQLTNTVGGAGAGGDGGKVTVISTGSIQTLSADSVAVIAQSIGGGGGNGAFSVSAQDGSLDGSALQVGGGGAGTQGANGPVLVQISGGTILTGGDLSYGLLSQAIGGGGGNGALSVPDPLTIGILGSAQNVGSSGTISGDGNPLNAQNANVIGTTGAGSIGFAGQSIGGGGGTSGVTGDVTFTAAGPLSLTVGGSASGAGGRSGGSAVVANTASLIQTGGDAATPASGDAAVGLLGQSIGGGGGSALYAFGVVSGTAGHVTLTLGGSETGVANGGPLTLTSGGQITTLGRFAPAVIGQTIGGGGGFGAVTASSGISASGVQFQLGSTGGVGGNADPTNGSTWAINSGTIGTDGLLSDAIVAQAIGAGGGLAGFVSDGAQKPALAGFVVGAAAGAAGNGSSVVLGNQSTILTTKAGALGIIAQSIGGGGGTAQAYGVSGVGPVILGASGGAGGNGGLVTLSSAAAITTSGEGAHAILAQSIGGGGGFVEAFDGPLLALNVQAGAGSAGGNGGDVTVKVQAAIKTTGAGAHGVIAQSVGGGGGMVGAGEFATALPTFGSFAGSVGAAGTAGAVEVDATANIMALGVNSTGIVVASTDATGRGGPIIVTVATGAIVAGGVGSGGTPGNGDEPANAVRFIGGAANKLTNHGYLTTVSGVAGFTVTGGLGDDAVDNFGRVDGSVDLSAGANSFHNEATTDNFLTTGIFNSGAIVWLGGANLLQNDGLISPGAYLNELTTNVTGNFLQTPTGVYGLDLEFKDQTSDRINVLQTGLIGGQATVGGAVNVNILNPGLAVPGSHVVTILHAEGGETHPGLGLTSVPTAVATYGLAYTPTDINLDYAINFSPAGLTLNEHSVGYAVNAIQTARSSPAFVPIAAALFYQPTVAALGAVYDSLSGEGVSGFEQTAFQADDLFVSSVMQQTDFWLSDHKVDPSGVTLCERHSWPYPSGDTAQEPYDTLKAPRPCEQRTWRAWFAGYGAGSRVSGELPLGSATLRDNGSGISAGLDYQLRPEALIGFAAGAGSSGFGVADRATSGSLQTGHVALYGAGRAGSFYTSAVFAYNWSDVNERRFAMIPGTNAPIVPVPGFAENLIGNFRADSFSGRIEAGWKTSFAAVNVTPFLAFQFDSLNMHGFSETADHQPSAIGLTFADKTIASLPSFLGAKFETDFALPSNMTLSTSLQVSWMHEFEVYRPIQAAFLAAPGFYFSVNGALAPRDSARVNAGLKLDLTSNFALFTNFIGDFSGKGETVAGTGGVKIAW